MEGRMFKPFEIRTNTDQSILKVSLGASALAYISVIFNVVVFFVLFRKRLLSPATILMQALAVADCLTSFFAYGLEPLFNTYYKQVVYLQQSNMVELKYPLCETYVHFHYLSEDFHLVSIMMTTCIGIQKCVAMHFPIWTKCHLNKRKSVYACIACFVFALSLNIPRHFALQFTDQMTWFAAQCAVTVGPLVKYGLVEHLLTSISISLFLSVIMIMCTIYIAVKLKTNTFRGRQVVKSKAERRSILMVFLILAIFVISETPRMLLNVFIWIDTTEMLEKSSEADLVTYIADNRFRMAIYIQLAAKIPFDTALILAECRTIFTLVGCVSNFIIYVSSSQKMREELLKIFSIRHKGNTRQKNPIQLNNAGNANKNLSEDPDAQNIEKKAKNNLSEDPNVQNKEKKAKNNLSDDTNVQNKEKKAKNNLSDDTNVQNKEKKAKNNLSEDTNVQNIEEKAKNNLSENPNAQNKEENGKNNLSEDPNVQNKEKKAKNNLSEDPNVQNKEEKAKNNPSEDLKIQNNEKKAKNNPSETPYLQDIQTQDRGN